MEGQNEVKSAQGNLKVDLEIEVKQEEKINLKREERESDNVL